MDLELVRRCLPCCRGGRGRFFALLYIALTGRSCSSTATATIPAADEAAIYSAFMSCSSGFVSQNKSGR